MNVVDVNRGPEGGCVGRKISHGRTHMVVLTTAHDDEELCVSECAIIVKL